MGAKHMSHNLRHACPPYRFILLLLFFCFTKPTAAQSDDDDTPAFSYYYVFVIPALFLLLLYFWFRARRRRIRSVRAATGQQTALLQDAAGWPRARYFGQTQADGGTGNRVGSRAYVGTMLDGTADTVTRHEGLDERGEAPPPYKPPGRGAQEAAITELPSVAAVGRTHYNGINGRRTREDIDKPPDYA